MKLPALLSRSVDSLPGLTGIARIDRNTARLLSRVGIGDVVVLDCPDIDRDTAEALVQARVGAVVNTSPSISGRYPNPGPDILIAAGIELVDVLGADLSKRVRDGMVVRVHEGTLYAGERVLAAGVRLDAQRVAQAVTEARNGLLAHLEAFSGNMIELIRTESALLLDGSGVPEVDVRLDGRHVVVVADGPGHMAELKKLKPFIREYAPVLIGVDRGADGLIRAGYRPDVIVGNPDQITGNALRCGAEVVLPADPDGHAPGLERIQDLGVGAVTFPAVGSSMDLALLLTHHHGASLIVTVGSRVSLDNLFDRHTTSASPAAFLTRLKVGARVVDAGAIATLYRSRLSATVVALLILAALIAVTVAVLASNMGGEVLDLAALWWHRGVAKAQELFG